MTSNPKSYDDLLRNQAFVRSLARRLTVDPHTANDLAQETFVAALQHPPRSTTSMRSYLSRTLRNLASNHRRTEYRYARRLRSLPSPDPSTPTSEEIVRLRSALQGLEQAVAGLSEKYRRVVLLYFSSGLSMAQVAEALQCPEDTVRTRLRRALQQLRQKMDRRFDGDRHAWAALLLHWTSTEPTTKPAIETPRSHWPASAPLVLAGVSALFLTFFLLVRFSGQTESELPLTSSALPVATTTSRAERSVLAAPSTPRISPTPSQNPTTGASLRVDGVVRDSEGQPISGALVFFGSPDDHWAFYSRQHLGQQIDSLLAANPDESPWFCGETDTRGQFQIACSQKLVGYSLVSYSPDHGMELRTGVRLDPAQPVLSLDVELPAGTSFRGQLLDSFGRPLQDAFVEVSPLWNKGTSLISAPLLRLRSDATGEFATCPIPEDRVRLTIRSPDHCDEQQIVDATLGGDLGTFQLQRLPRSHWGGLASAGFLSDLWNEIQNAWPAGQRADLPPLRVFLSRATQAELGTEKASAVSGRLLLDEGVYEFPGPEKIPDGATVYLTSGRTILAAQPIRDRELPDLEGDWSLLEWLKPRSLTITVRDDQTRQCKEGFDFYYRRLPRFHEEPARVLKGNQHQRCEESQLSLSGLLPVPYMAWVTAEGMRSKCVLIDTEQQKATLDLMPARSCLRVSVLSAQGVLRTSDRISLLSRERLAGLPGVAASRNIVNGEFLFTQMLSGLYQIAVSPPLFASKENWYFSDPQNVKLRDGTAVLRIQLPEVTPVRLKVSRADGSTPETLQAVIGKDWKIGLQNDLENGMTSHNGVIECELVPGAYGVLFHTPVLRTDFFQFQVPADAIEMVEHHFQLSD